MRELPLMVQSSVAFQELAIIPPSLTPSPSPPSSVASAYPIPAWRREGL